MRSFTRVEQSTLHMHDIDNSTPIALSVLVRMCKHQASVMILEKSQRVDMGVAA